MPGGAGAPDVYDGDADDEDSAMLHLLPTVLDGEPVTDARFPDRWMIDRRHMTLPGEAFRTYVLSLTWSASNRTDGLIHADELAMVPGGGVSDAHRDLFIRKELWAKQGDAYLILDFDTTQTSAAQLRAYEEQALKERDRKRARRGTGKSKGPDSPPDGPGDGGPPTKDRTGQATTRQEGEVTTDEQFSGSDADQMVSPPLDRSSPFAVENGEWEREWGTAS